MPQDLYWMYAFNIIVNSALSFFTALLLVEFSMRLLRIKHPRAKGICRFLPFCKICIDLCLYHFSNWALLQGINPILAEKGARNLSLIATPFAGIRLSMESGEAFSIADLIALSTHILFVQTIVLIAAAGMALACTLHLIRFFRAKRSIDRIVRDSTAVEWPNFQNQPLAELLKKKGVECALTPAVDAPCIAKKTILFPTRLYPGSDTRIGRRQAHEVYTALSQEEVEAVIAHEMGHLQWRDRSFRLAYSTIAAVFWWIPTQWWQRRIEEMQEQASDSMIHQFGISKFALAEAVLKTAQSAKLPSKFLCSFVKRRPSLKHRMKMILQEPKQCTLSWSVLQYGALGLGLLSILFGKLWIL